MAAGTTDLPPSALALEQPLDHISEGSDWSDSADEKPPAGNFIQPPEAAAVETEIHQPAAVSEAEAATTPSTGLLSVMVDTQPLHAPKQAPSQLQPGLDGMGSQKRKQTAMGLDSEQAASALQPGNARKRHKQQATADATSDDMQQATDPLKSGASSKASKKSKPRDVADILKGSQGVSQRRKDFLKARRQKAKSKKNRKSALETEVEAEAAFLGESAPEPAFGEQAQQPLKVTCSSP